MNAPDRTSSLSTDEQAALWAARLDGSSLSPADRRAFDSWLNADPEHRVRLSAYCQLSADLEQNLRQLSEAGRVFAPPDNDEGVESHTPRRHRAYAWWSLAAAAAAVALAVSLWRPTTDLDSAQVATATAQRDSLSLSDGSRIDVYAQTNLRIELTPRDRRVRLGSGEAYFAVARNAARPFVIETPSGSVHVTGTAFSVRTASEGSLTVLVREGSVQVRTGDADRGPFELRGGQRLRSSPGSHVVDEMDASEIDAALAWREGQVVFAGTPLSEALSRFAHYHGRGLAASPEAAGLTLGGRYSLDDLDEFLAAIEAALPVRVSRGLNGVIHVGLRKSE